MYFKNSLGGRGPIFKAWRATFGPRATGWEPLAKTKFHQCQEHLIFGLKFSLMSNFSGCLSEFSLDFSQSTCSLPEFEIRYSGFKIFKQYIKHFYLGNSCEKFYIFIIKFMIAKLSSFLFVSFVFCIYYYIILYILLYYSVYIIVYILIILCYVRNYHSLLHVDYHNHNHELLLGC